LCLPIGGVEGVICELLQGDYNEPVILLGEGTKKEVLEMFRKNHMKPKIEYRTEDDYTIVSMVENELSQVSALPLFDCS
jgi:hypothetical protein